jgi:GT2 family glycosyltransferase
MDATPSNSAKANKIRLGVAPQIAAAICAYNPSPIWRDVVERLCRFSFNEVVVVDDGSVPPLELPSTTRGVASLRILRCSVNCGLAAARNHALKNIDADWVLFVDSDVMPSEGFLATLPKRLYETPADGMGFQVREYHRRSDWDYYRTCEREALKRQSKVEWLSGLLCAYRTSSLRAAHGFNPEFRTNGEDVDIGYRLTRAGETLLYVPEICGDHYRKDTISSFLQMHYRYAVTAKRVDRSLYFPASKIGGAPPVFHLRSVWPQIRFMLQFVWRRPRAFYLPPLVLAATFYGAYRGRKKLKETPSAHYRALPSMNLAVKGLQQRPHI